MMGFCRDVLHFCWSFIHSIQQAIYHANYQTTAANQSSWIKNGILFPEGGMKTDARADHNSTTIMKLRILQKIYSNITDNSIYGEQTFR